jgi:hypothetical protein
VLWVVSGLVVLAGACVLLRACVEISEGIGAEAVAEVQGPAVRVVRKCKPPEKGWCVLEVARLEGEVPERCECGPLPKEYASLLEPDRSWEVLRDYRRSLRKGKGR